MIPTQRQLFAAYVLSALAVLVAAGGSVLHIWNASVKVSVPPQRVAVAVTLSGDLQTQRIHADVTDSQQGTSSTVVIGPTFASGQVVFRCSPACQQLPVNIPQGTLVSTIKSLGYATQAAATITATNPSPSVGVRATASGAAWNTGADTVKTITNGPDKNLQVSNPAAIAGGADDRKAQVIQQSDFDAVRNTLTARVNDELTAALKVNAQGLSYVADGLPVINIMSDHKVGDETPTFAITMTGTLGGISFSESQAQTLLRAALEAKMSSSQELTTDPIQAVYQVGQSSANGGATVIAKASAYVIPKLSSQSLRLQIRGMTPAQAASSLQRTAPGSVVEIKISPAAVPWLPVVPNNIAITVVVEPAPLPGGL